MFEQSFRIRKFYGSGLSNQLLPRQVHTLES
jgi:hypothetical protein